MVDVGRKYGAETNMREIATDKHDSGLKKQNPPSETGGSMSLPSLIPDFQPPELRGGKKNLS